MCHVKEVVNMADKEKEEHTSKHSMFLPYTLYRGKHKSVFPPVEFHRKQFGQIGLVLGTCVLETDVS